VQHVIKQQEMKIGCHAKSANHAKCMNIKDEAYKVLQQLDSCHWYCRSCNAGVGKLLPTLTKLEFLKKKSLKLILILENPEEG